MTEQETLKGTCDKLVELAAESMQAAGAPVGMILDRLMTYAVAQACVVEGSAKAADLLRHVAGNVEAGAFHRITGEGGARH